MKISERLHKGAQYPSSAEPESRENVAQFRELMANLHQVFWMMNAADTAVLYVSPAYETIWGRSRESLYDSAPTFLDSIHSDDRERMREVMSKKRETKGYDEEYRIVRPDGSIRWIWARTYPVRDEAKAIKRYAGIAEDITERKWAEKERSRLVAIIEHAEDAIVSITLSGIIVAWNRGAENKYGYTADEVVGRSILILIPPDRTAEYLAMMAKVRGGESVAAYETVRRRKDGALINFRVGISPIESLEGGVVGVSKVGHDISQVRKLEAQLIESQKMELAGQFTGGVAHDFNNILAVVLGYSELMLSSLGPDHPQSQHATAIRNAGERGAALTRQLLVFSRKENMQAVVTDLNDVLEQTLGMLRQLIREDITLVTSPGVNLGLISADRGGIGQVLMNLVVNARDAMPDGGRIMIATENVTLDVDYASAHPGVAVGDYVMITVADTGLGIPDEIKGRLFEPFFTTKPKGKGTGLGLPTCRTIVEQAGGHISVCSEIGKGTAFRIVFPRVVGLDAFVARPSRRDDLPRGTETLLVVEDDPDVRAFVCTALRAQGYDALAVSNGESGLRVVRDHIGPPIRLIISDVIMPRMGGRAMAGALEGGHPELRILFTSGYTEDAVALRGEGGREMDFLAKPYSIADLARKVRDMLDTPPTPASR